MRSIPACAGEPLFEQIPVGYHMVYPRVCGGTLCMITTRYAEWGLSPACAGEPLADKTHRWAMVGLSPRVRGN